MNKILLFEAFKSSIITKTLSSISEKDRNTFLGMLREDIELLKLPFSEITDSYIKVKNPEEGFEDYYSNPDFIFGENKLHSIKYWFSKRDKILRSFTISKNNNPKISDLDDLVTDYETLKTGDVVYVVLDNGLILKSVIFDDRPYGGSRLYAIQDRVSGRQSDFSDDWNKYGQYSYSIYRDDSGKGSDHRYIYRRVNGNSFENIIKGVEKLEKHNIKDYDYVVIFYIDEWVKNEKISPLVKKEKLKSREEMEIDFKNQTVDNIVKKLENDPKLESIFKILINEYLLFNDYFLNLLIDFNSIIKDYDYKEYKKVAKSIIDMGLNSYKHFNKIMDNSSDEVKDIIKRIKEVNDIIRSSALEIEDDKDIEIFINTMYIFYNSRFWEETYDIIGSIRNNHKLDYQKSKNIVDRLKKYVKSVF